MKCKDCKFYSSDMMTGDGEYLGHWGRCSYHEKSVECDDECVHLEERERSDRSDDSDGSDDGNCKEFGR